MTLSDNVAFNEQSLQMMEIVVLCSKLEVLNLWLQKGQLNKIHDKKIPHKRA